MGKVLKKYAIKLPGGVQSGDNFSKILAYSKGEANLFVHNVLEVRMGHHVFKNLGGIGNIKTFFADTNFIRDKINSEVTNIQKQIQEVLNKAVVSTTGAIGTIGGGGDNNTDPQITITPAEKQKLEEALNKIKIGNASVKDVNEAGSADSNGNIGTTDNDFNAQNITRAKTVLSEGLKSIVGDSNLLNRINTFITQNFNSSGSSSDSQQSAPTISSDVDKTVGKKLNCMRRWTFDTFEEEFNGEMYIDKNHEFKYTKTLKGMTEWANEFLKKCNINIKLKDEYLTAEDLEASIKVKLNHVSGHEIKVIEFERYEDVSDEYDGE